MKSDNRIAQFRELISEPKKIIITFHENPDGDALGAALGLKIFLQKTHQVTIISPNNYPEFLKWMPGSSNIMFYHKNKEEADKQIDAATLIICVDFNEIERLGNLSKTISDANAKKILIDHHPNPQDFADITFSTTEVSSAAELTYEILAAIDKTKICVDVATCLFTGIMTDTGTFHFNSTRPRTYEIVGELLKKKIDKDQIYSNVHDNYSENRFRFLGYCLNEKMTVIRKYHTAYIAIKQSDKEMFKYQIGDSEGFVNIPLSIKGIVFSVLFMEQEEGIKLSLRSKGDFSANLFARNHFNGGGHTNAAGGNTTVSIDEVVKQFEELLPKYQHQLTQTANNISVKSK